MQQPGPDQSQAVLPDGVRRVLLALAAEVLAGLTENEVPASLRRVQAFAPAKRAVAGAAALAAALERDPTFRTAVAAGWRIQHPDLADPLQTGQWPAAADPVQWAVGLYLTRPEGWAARLAEVVGSLQREGVGRNPGEDDAARSKIEVLDRLVTRWRSQAEQAELAVADLTEQLAQGRRELRRQRADADRARAQARDAQAEVQKFQAEAAQARAEQGAALQAADDRVRRADHEAALARRAARDGRSLATARARLLLDTVVDAASGLRRELALPPEIVLPADLVAAEQGLVLGAPPAEHRAQARAADDPSVLDSLVRLPRAHLVVDGYNVTKTGYPQLTLVDQRSRLVDALAPLAARTGAEITCCFDGAEVASRSAWLDRGVRVLFSEPGVTADDLIRRLVQAEPPGRALVVVSSDGEVAAAALAAAARAVPSTALLRLLDRGRTG
jgi:predicted RNA-binding protein with PIN domain